MEKVDDSFVTAWGQVTKSGGNFLSDLATKSLVSNISEEFQGAINQMSRPANRLLQDYRLEKISNSDENSFLNLDFVIDIKEAIDRGDETYPINLAQYQLDNKAVLDERDFLLEQLNIALENIEILQGLKS